MLFGTWMSRPGGLGTLFRISKERVEVGVEVPRKTGNCRLRCSRVLSDPGVSFFEKPPDSEVLPIYPASSLGTTALRITLLRIRPAGKKPILSLQLFLNCSNDRFLVLPDCPRITHLCGTRLHSRLFTLQQNTTLWASEGSRPSRATLST